MAKDKDPVEKRPADAGLKSSAVATIDFTIENVEAIRPPTDGDRAEYRDTRVQGLRLRVTKRGVKTFSFVGRAKGGGRTERKTIGKFPVVKPAEARTRARELAGHQAGGKSVTEEDRERRQAMKLSALWDLYYEHVCKTAKRPDDLLQRWRLYIEPTWGSRRLSEITPAAVERWHLALPEQILTRRQEQAKEIRAAQEAKRKAIDDRRKIRKHGPAPKQRSEEARATSNQKVDGKSTANRALSLLRAIFNFGLDHKRQYFAGINPAAKHAFFPETERERFLHPDELAPFFRALAQEPNEDVRDVILLALLTGQRRANVLAMTWPDVHLARAEWRIPGELTKNGAPHVAPLGPEAVELLRRRKEKHDAWIKGSTRFTPEEKRAAPYVFPSVDSATGHRVDPRRTWNRVRAVAGLQDLVLHDLRRTLGSWQARSGASLVMIGKSLNHKSPEATAIYARLDMDPVRESVERATTAMFQAAGLKRKNATNDTSIRRAS